MGAKCTGTELFCLLAAKLTLAGKHNLLLPLQTVKLFFFEVTVILPQQCVFVWEIQYRAKVS